MTVILSFVISCLWFLPLFFKQGKKDASPKRYTVFSILLGLTFGIIVGVMFTGLFGNFLNKLGLEEDSLLFMALRALFSAGLAEELSKFLCGSAFTKLAKPVRKLDYILIMGGAGFGFTLTENILYGLTGGAIAIVRVLLPLHIMWQLRMGGHLYEAKVAKDAGNKSLQRKELAKALVIPVLYHGFYDFSCFLTTRLSNSIDWTANAEDIVLNAGQTVELATFIGTLLFSFVYCIVTEVWAAKQVKASRLADVSVADIEGE